MVGREFNVASHSRLANRRSNKQFDHTSVINRLQRCKSVEIVICEKKKKKKTHSCK
jgi:hypothetical protein